MADLLNIRDITVNDRDEYLNMYKELYDSNATTTDYDEEIAILNFKHYLTTKYISIYPLSEKFNLS